MRRKLFSILIFAAGIMLIVGFSRTIKTLKRMKKNKNPSQQNFNSENTPTSDYSNAGATVDFSKTY